MESSLCLVSMIDGLMMMLLDGWIMMMMND